uniref:CHK kinase-like domain-containing protein n=1 Tax=Panagrolaimus sp. ES5 TaxID=591445 RepID=A0AC34G7V7_9BILA
MSEIIRCSLIFTDSIDQDDVYTTILKIPGTTALFKANSTSENNDDELMEKMIMPIIEVHEAECKFYDNLAPILDAPVPEVYKTLDWIVGKQDGCIHMEDLTSRGKNLTFFDDINLTQVQNVIKHIAHMHKNILVTDPIIWKDKYIQDVVKPLVEKIQKVITNIDFFHFIFNKTNKNSNLQPVIVHGDIHLGNILWCIDKNGNIQDDVAAFVDWQIVHESSPMTDLGRFLTMGPSGKIRRQAELFAIDYYLECLIKEFDGDASKVPYTAEQLKESYNYVFLYNILFVISAGVFFFNTVEEDESNKDKKDACFENAKLKIQLACKDAIRLLEGDMKHLLEKFGS